MRPVTLLTVGQVRKSDGLRTGGLASLKDQRPKRAIDKPSRGGNTFKPSKAGADRQDRSTASLARTSREAMGQIAMPAPFTAGEFSGPDVSEPLYASSDRTLP